MPQDVNLTITDGALGALPTPTDEIHAVIGTSSAGTANTIVSCGTIAALVAAFGQGPLVEAAAFSIAQTGAPVLAVRVASNTAGANSAVTFAGTGTSVITLTGAPYDTYQGLFTVTTGGTIGVTGIKFTVSLDGGLTTSAEISLGVATTYLIPNSNVTLNFAAGTFVAADTAVWTSTQPLWLAADVATAIATLQNSVYDFSFVHVTGKASAAEATTITAAVTTMATNYRYVFAMLEARDNNAGESEATWIGSLQTDYAAFANVRASIAAGHYRITSPITGRKYRRSIAFAAAARAVAVPIHVDLARVADGSLSGVETLGTGIFHDERSTTGLDSARFLTARTLLGLPGWYILNANIMCSPGSDFTYIQYRRIMDVACRTARIVMLQYLSADVRLNRTTGYILEKDALSIESRLRSSLRDTLVAPGHASSAIGTVSRTDNLSSTKTMNTTVRVLPPGYLKTINVDLAFSNPALDVAA